MKKLDQLVDDETFVNEDGYISAELETMPFDKAFTDEDGNESLYHALGYQSRIDGTWWNAYDVNGTIQYGR